MCKRLSRLRDSKNSIIASLLYDIKNLLFYFFEINILLFFSIFIKLNPNSLNYLIRRLIDIKLNLFSLITIN
jgi:hypothetical protein